MAKLTEMEVVRKKTSILQSLKVGQLVNPE
jgi:hypothetical protein